MGVNFVQASVDFSGLILQTTMCAVVATNHLERRLSQSWGLQKWDFFALLVFLGGGTHPAAFTSLYFLLLLLLQMDDILLTPLAFIKKSSLRGVNLELCVN